MKKTFYNPHTVITDITNLDKKWLEKQNSEKPYDQHYAYLEALRLIGTGSEKEFISKVGELLYKSSGKVRISSLLDRATPVDHTANSISSIEIKSKKSEEMAKLSPLLVGLVPLVSAKEDELSQDQINIDANNISDTTESPTSLTIDVIDISDVEDEAIVKESDTPPAEDTEIFEKTGSTTAITDEDEEEEEEYVSNIVNLEQTQSQTKQDTEPITVSQADLIEQKTLEGEKESYRFPTYDEDDMPSISESVQIEHSKFTSWLKGLPRLNETNQLPEFEGQATIISEPYAKILVEQGHKSDAIRMYEQLMLKYPEKSSFFAVQIKKLK